MSSALHDDSLPRKSPPSLASPSQKRTKIADDKQSSPRGRPRSQQQQNGDRRQHSSDEDDHHRDNAANESEAETVVLHASPQKKVIKSEHSDDSHDSDDAARLHSIKEASRPPGGPQASNGRKSSQGNHDAGSLMHRSTTTNGTDAKHDDVKSPDLPTSPSSRTASRHTKDTSPADSQRSPVQSAASPPQSTARPRSASTTESRKRKARDEPHARSLEPPRQKAKTEGLKESRTQPASPATVGRPHKRSHSIQSVAYSAPGRKRRDVTSLSIPTERRDWSESSSERSSSPRQAHSAGLPSQVRKRSSRNLTSPARTMTHKRNVDKFGATRLARESEKGDLAAVKAAYEAAPDELNQEDFAGITPLQKAALHGYDDVVEFLLKKGCRTDVQSGDRDTPLIDAVENGHLQVVKLLLNEGHVNPHHQNRKGQRAIDVMNADEDDYEEIEKVLVEAMKQHSEDTSRKDEYSQKATPSASRLLYNEYNTETLIEKAADGDIQAVGELVASGVRPNIACGVAAARGGHDDILSILLASGLKADYDPSKHSETPMLVAIGRGHLDIVKMIANHEEFNPTRKNREGKYYWEISEDRRGPKWELERNYLKEAAERYQSKRKSPQRNRKEAPNTSAIRKRKPSRERSASPRHEPKRRDVREKAATVPTKSRRLMSGKDIAARRKRTIVSSDESSDDSSEDDVRPPAKETTETKPRSFSDGEDVKPVKKTSPKKTRPEGPSRSEGPSRLERKRTERARSEDSEHSDHPKRPKIRQRVEKVYRSKPTPTPEVESDHERKPIVNKLIKIKKVKTRRPSDVSMSHDEGKPKNTPTASTKSTPAPLEKAGTPEITQERRREADRQASEAKRKATDTEARLQEERDEAARKAAADEESRKKAQAKAEAEEAESKRKREEEEATRIKQEEEAEASRRRSEAEEEAKRQKAALERQTRLAKLPKALRRACELGNNRPLHFSGEELGISAVFLPLFYATESDLKPTVSEDKGKENEKPSQDDSEPMDTKSKPPTPGQNAEEEQHDNRYIMSFQATGILGLPELDLAHLPAPYDSWSRLPVTRKHRELLLRQYDIALLAQDYRFPFEGTEGFDFEAVTKAIREAREQFLDMGGLYWIPAEQFIDEVEKVESLASLVDDIKDREKMRHIPVGEVVEVKKEIGKGGKSHRPRKSFMDVVLERGGILNGGSAASSRAGTPGKSAGSKANSRAGTPGKKSRAGTPGKAVVKSRAATPGKENGDPGGGGPPGGGKEVKVNGDG